MKKILSDVSNSIDRFFSLAPIEAELEDLSLDNNDLIIINNSFIYREKASIKTTKNEYYLSVPVIEGELACHSPIVISGLMINSDWKKIPGSAREELNEIPLAQAVESELSKLGRLLFILIGKVDDTLVLEENMSSRHFSKIVWNPQLDSQVDVHGDSISIRDAMDEQAVWESLENELQSTNEDLLNDLREPLAIAMEKLKDEAIAMLILPQPGEAPDNSMIDSIITVLKEQHREYNDAIEKVNNGGEVPNEVLRIAYNFASDALIFIRLMVSICDLKPLVLWGTITEHYFLAYTLKDLPWQTKRTKPSLRNYRRTIADARNSAFHNLFPFRKSLRIDLPDASLRNAALQIFSEHGKKSDNELLYQDKELVDLLFEFTRARERFVPLNFWRKNIKVMEATIDLCERTAYHLKALLSTR